MTEERPEPDRRPSPPDLLEHGAPKAGIPQTLDARLFVQLQVFTGCSDAAVLVDPIRRSGLDAVLYADVNDPRGVGLLTMSEDPEIFTGPARALLAHPPFDRLTHRPELTMLPSEYFARHCVIASDSDDDFVAPTIATVGADHVAWSSDFPHLEARWPDGVRVFAEQRGIAPVDLDEVLWRTPCRLYGVNPRARA